MSNSAQSWSIIIFAYNEGGNIEGVIKSADEVLEQIAPSESELLVVDDGSTDNTEQIVNRFSEAGIRYIKHETNKGIGQALRTGYSSARHENICAVPGDAQFDLQELIPFAQFNEDEVIAFYRRENQEYNLFRNWLSWINKIFNGWLLGMRMKDVNWVKIYKKTQLDSIPLNLKSSLIESEICAKLIAKGIHINEVESKYLPRIHGVDKGASWKVISQAAGDTWVLISEVWKFKKRYKKSK